MPKVEFFRGQTHLWRILSQNGAQVVIFHFFFDMLSESVRDICMTSSELLTNLEIAEFYEWTMDNKTHNQNESYQWQLIRKHLPKATCIQNK